MENLEFKLVREEFEQWLRTLPPNEIVGLPKAAHQCPIASYVKTRVDSRFFDVTVRASLVRIDAGDWHQTYPNPKWASDFVDRIDTYAPYNGVTARKALKFLTFTTNRSFWVWREGCIECPTRIRTTPNHATYLRVASACATLPRLITAPDRDTAIYYYRTYS